MEKNRVVYLKGFLCRWEIILMAEYDHEFMILLIDKVHAMMSKSWHLVVLEFKYHYTSILLACPARLYPICVRSDSVTGFRED